MVERLFSDIAQNRIWRSVFRYLEQLITAIDDQIDGHDQKPPLLIWTANATDIPEKVTRARPHSINEICLEDYTISGLLLVARDVDWNQGRTDR